MSGDVLPSAVHPDRVRAALDPRLSDATVARLLACARLRERLDARLGRGDAIGVARGDSADTDEAEHAWLLADPDGAARRAGAALHGQALRSIVAGPAVAALVAAIGRDAHAFGLRNAVRAAPRDARGDLAGAILHDGYACLGAWLAGAPDSLRRAVLLALPPGTPAEAEAFDPALAERAGPIMALVAMSAQHEDAHA
ncbi:nodulation protein NolU [Methylorubrum populi]|uniref:Nodulation protein NolU n=1 Tax=Methylorubrum populi TaxID=223967 RepID=A0A160PB04_9HYPH|nr:nodulation protein NolU [Methylorubrum populi]BAU89957.1 nodulation protein NolU [Methylorubrum populi]